MNVEAALVPRLLHRNRARARARNRLSLILQLRPCGRAAMSAAGIFDFDYEHDYDYDWAGETIDFSFQRFSFLITSGSIFLLTGLYQYDITSI